MSFGLEVNDASGIREFSSIDLTLRTVFTTTVTLSGENVNISVPNFDPSKGVVVVTFFNGNLPDYIPLPRYEILGSFPNVYVRVYRRFSGQRDQPLSIWAVHYR